MRCYFVHIAFLGLVFPGPISLANTTEVEKLVTLAPEDILACVGSSGLDALEPAFEKSLLGQIGMDAGVQAFYQSTKQSLVTLIEKDLKEQGELENSGRLKLW